MKAMHHMATWSERLVLRPDNLPAGSIWHRDPEFADRNTPIVIPLPASPDGPTSVTLSPLRLVSRRILACGGMDIDRWALVWRAASDADVDALGRLPSHGLGVIIFHTLGERVPVPPAWRRWADQP